MCCAALSLSLALSAVVGLFSALLLALCSAVAILWHPAMPRHPAAVMIEPVLIELTL